MATGFLPEFSTIQQGLGVPTHQAANGTFYLDRASGGLYYNLTGGTTWSRTGLGSGTAADNVLAAARVITAADNGKTFFLALAGGFDVTLPANASSAGVVLRFIASVNPTTAYTITAATADTIVGWPINCGGADSVANGNAAGDVLNFVANTALAGDMAEFFCDGTMWYVRAVAKAIGAITITG